MGWPWGRSYRCCRVQIRTCGTPPSALHGSTITDGLAVGTLVSLLSSPDPDLRDAAASALQGSTITDGLAAGTLVSLLSRTDPDLRDAAASALQWTTIADPQAARYLATVRGNLERP
jgi:HEAT repeat protein